MGGPLTTQATLNAHESYPKISGAVTLSVGRGRGPLACQSAAAAPRAAPLETRRDTPSHRRCIVSSKPDSGSTRHWWELDLEETLKSYASHFTDHLPERSAPSEKDANSNFFRQSEKEKKEHTNRQPKRGMGEEDRVPTCTSRILEGRSGGQVGSPAPDKGHDRLAARCTVDSQLHWRLISV